VHREGQLYPVGTAPHHIVKAFKAKRGEKRITEIHQVFEDLSIQVTKCLPGGAYLVTTEF
jgi:hypothetical protein